MGMKIVPELTDSLAKVTTNEYDTLGRMVEVRTTDPSGTVTQKRITEYDKNNHVKRRAVVNADGSIDQETISTYSQNGHEIRTTYKTSTGAIGSHTVKLDDKGREVLNEEFVPGPRVANSKTDSPLVLRSRGISSYSDDITNFELITWNDNGEPNQRLVTVNKGQFEISRNTFIPGSLADESKENSSKPRWILFEEELRDYEFDTQPGNVIREISRKRSSPDKPFHYVSVLERVIVFF
jgi:hypothetical protein